MLVFIILLPFSLSLVNAADLCDGRVFNWNFYLSHNKGLIRSGLSSLKDACNHWRTHGANQGLQAHPAFHTRQYCDNYADLRQAGYCFIGVYSRAVNHYLDNGYREKRKGYNFEGRYGTWTASNGLLSMTISALHGGSVSSIVYKEHTEIVNSYDRGRQLQFAFSDSSGENNNPTEGGSSRDGISDRSTSRILGARVTDSSIATTSQPAYWRGGLSNFIVSKAINLNINGNPHLFSYDMSFTMAQSYNMLALECPTLYMPFGFDIVYEMYFPAKMYSRVPLPVGQKPAYTPRPIMFSNAHNVAVGVRMKTVSGLKLGQFLYAYFGILSSANQLDWTTKWSAWYHNAVPVRKGTRITAKVYIAVGTPQEVVSSLASV